jgi:NTP pyrophosphatase (non-canonical NTP hydrolase)
MDIAALQRRLRQFAAERGWDELNTPKNLSTALMVEAAELAEIFQWMSPEESRRTQADALLHQAVSDEIADVFIYLVTMADRTGVDIEQAVAGKLLKNAVKYPAKRPA